MKITRRQLRRLISESLNSQVGTNINKVKWPISLKDYEDDYGVKIAYLEPAYDGKNWSTLYHPEFPGGVMECVSPENEQYKGSLSLDPTGHGELLHDFLKHLVLAKKKYGITHVIGMTDYFDGFHQRSFNSDDGGKSLQIENLIKTFDPAGIYIQYHHPHLPDFDDEWI